MLARLSGLTAGSCGEEPCCVSPLATLPEAAPVQENLSSHPKGHFTPHWPRLQGVAAGKSPACLLIACVKGRSLRVLKPPQSTQPGCFQGGTIGLGPLLSPRSAQARSLHSTCQQKQKSSCCCQDKSKAQQLLYEP